LFKIGRIDIRPGEGCHGYADCPVTGPWQQTAIGVAIDQHQAAAVSQPSAEFFALGTVKRNESAADNYDRCRCFGPLTLSSESVDSAPACYLITGFMQEVVKRPVPVAPAFKVDRSGDVSESADLLILVLGVLILIKRRVVRKGRAIG